MQGGNQYVQYPQQQGSSPQYQGAAQIQQQQQQTSIYHQPPIEQSLPHQEQNDGNVNEDVDDDQNSDLLFEQQEAQAAQSQDSRQATPDQDQYQQHHIHYPQQQQMIVNEQNHLKTQAYPSANLQLATEQRHLSEQGTHYRVANQESADQQSVRFYPPTSTEQEYPNDQTQAAAQYQSSRQPEQQDTKLVTQQDKQPQKNKSYNQILNPTTPSHSHYQQNLKKVADLIKAGEIDHSIALMEKIGVLPRDFKYQAFQHNCIFFASVIKNDDLCKNAIQRFIEQGVDITYMDILKQSILFYLAREGHTKCIQLAVENGCSGVNNADTYKQTPLYYAAREGKVEAAERLIQLGANVEVEDHAQQSPLFYAAKSGKVQMVKLLIRWGANVNKRDKRKCTPLMQARRNNQSEVVQVLLQNGATSQPDPTQKKKAQSKKKSNQKKKVNVDKVSTKKYILHRQKENGQWEPVPIDQWELFKEQCPQVANYLENPQLLNKLNIPDIPDTMQLFDCWQKSAKKIIQVLWKHQGARIFHEPVDSEALQIPDYPDIVKNPMDFGTIKKRLNTFSYKNGQEFLNDMKLVFDNCILYNGANSEVGMIARSIEEEFNNQFEILNFNYYLK